MAFSHVDTWIFNLDNTLYAPGSGIFDQVQARMNAYVARLLDVDPVEARRIRAGYRRTHATTLAGLMAEHDIDPHNFLQDVHDVDLTALSPDPDLAAAIAALPGIKIVHTNADTDYASRVLNRLALPDFVAVYGIEETGFWPKPDPRAYAAVIAAHGIDGTRAAMFEDDPRNLREPALLKMQTILVGCATNDPDDTAFDPRHAAYVHHRTANLTQFLRELV